MRRATKPKSTAHPTKWTLVFPIKLMRFDTLQGAEAELEKAESEASGLSFSRRSRPRTDQ
jgi:hypothetical protein